MMKKLRWWLPVLLTGYGSVAGAHDLICEKTVNGQSAVTVNSYPATVQYRFTVTNIHPTDVSIADTADDALLASRGFAFSPAPPFALDVGASTSMTFDVTLASEADCLALAAADGTVDANVDNVFVVTFDSGSAMCTARVVCGSPPPPPPGGGATRTMGFFKTHEPALSQCLASGAIDLGFMKISTLSEALGLLWASPPRFGDGTRRGELDKLRLLLGRQTLTAICNQRLFGTTTDLIASAVSALASTDCSLIASLISMVDAFNNSGDSIGFPAGFDPGKATPRHAQSIAVDPTTPSGEVCQ
jgi:hypothetical protein